MPCLILTGYPQCGTAQVAQVLERQAQALGLANRVVVIRDVDVGRVQSNDDSERGFLGDDYYYDVLYKNAQAEKSLRGALKAAFDRTVGSASTSASTATRTLVILDSLNYIKGFRYELHCISKAAGERHGVVWVQQPERSMATSSSPLIQQLIQRYEPPDQRNRWDCPLYHIQMPRTNSSETTSKQREQQTEKSKTAIRKNTASSTFRRATTPKATAAAAANNINNPTQPATRNCAPASTATTCGNDTLQSTTTAIAERVASLDEQVTRILKEFFSDTVAPLKQGTSTRRTEASDANVLHRVDVVTNQVCRELERLQTQQDDETSTIVLSESQQQDNIQVHIPSSIRTLAALQLQAFRKQYLQWVATYPPQDASKKAIAFSFVEYMQAQHKE